MDIMDLLKGDLSQDLLGTLSKQLGGADERQTQVAAKGAIGAIASALANNASTSDGANSLVSALDRDHDGSIMDDLVGMLSGTKQARNTSTMNGAGILRHVLGGKQNNVVSMISKMSGLDNGKSGSLLAMLAPMVMGSLGKARNQRGFGVKDIAKLLTNSVQTEQKQDKQLGLIGKFLDSDGDGSIMDDLANIGMNFLRK